MTSTLNTLNRCVAIVRRPQHLDQACLLENKPAHFVCLSLDTFLLGRERGLSVSTPSNYSQLHDNFTMRGRQLALSWVREIIAPSFGLSRDQQLYFTSQLTFFFAMALFSLALIKAIVEQHRPEKVYVWRDPERTVLGDWMPGTGDGAVFAQVTAAWLNCRGIPVDYLHTPPSETTNRLIGTLRSYKSYIPAHLRALSRSSYLILRLVPTSLHRLKLRIHVALMHWRRRHFKHPLILFWGSHTDAIYQAELAGQWKKNNAAGTRYVSKATTHPLLLIETAHATALYHSA